jgi:pSer/pThr/pTyr-binding forkhead associated (FHA) protein
MSVRVDVLPAPSPNREILAADVSGAVLLEGMTDEARAALGHTLVRIATFPFNIGRESRAHTRMTRALVSVERRLSAAPQVNDLYLLTPPAEPLVQISRRHCAIDRLGDTFLLLDRNSMCGAGIVRSRLNRLVRGPFVDRIGSGTPTDRAILYDGDLIVLGNEDSPYVFRFQYD